MGIAVAGCLPPIFVVELMASVATPPSGRCTVTAVGEMAVTVPRSKVRVTQPPLSLTVKTA
ncbi:MAG: hypothetical protein M0007_11520 [Actinomycetota bacterium]|nr:hypothetical protein [Actinomycetota bacterium]